MPTLRKSIPLEIITDPIMSDTPLKKYRGNCHCGAFQFSIEIPEVGEVTICNCTICLKKGYLGIRAPASALIVTKGEDSLADYKFGKELVAHKVHEN